MKYLENIPNKIHKQKMYLNKAINKRTNPFIPQKINKVSFFWKIENFKPTSYWFHYQSNAPIINLPNYLLDNNH
jgi:hypothetical protein